jgi:hypothetical protein
MHTFNSSQLNYAQCEAIVVKNAHSGKKITAVNFSQTEKGNLSSIGSRPSGKHE